MNRVTGFLLSILALPFLLQAKVYDCFPFFNELELLEMRFEELDEIVDYFVLVESIETQRGDSKHLYFKENQHRFKKYLPKIIHVMVEERHPEMGLWERENFQRNCIMRGLKNCHKSDVILISDLDEIPRASVIKKLAPLLASAKPVSFAESPSFRSGKNQSKFQKKYAQMGTYALQMGNYYYQLNRQIDNVGEDGWHNRIWCGTVIMPYAKLMQKTPQYFRNKKDKLPKISQAGWHFSWMGGREKIRLKLSSIVEGRDKAEVMTDEEIDRWLARHPPVPIDDSFPDYVHKNIIHLKEIGFVAEK